MEIEPKELQVVNLPILSTKRPISEGAEKWLGQPIRCLDHGFVYLVDYMGNDFAIEESARRSYGKGTRKTSQSRGLIRYLHRHDHTTPRERPELVFYTAQPIFVARQWVRTRMASINELSGRYSILDNEFYLPDYSVIAVQSPDNKQGRGNIVPKEYADMVRSIIINDSIKAYETYDFLLNDDGTGRPKDPTRPMVARELARINLNLGFYTEWYWKIDLHNFMRFAKLRLDPHAQFEIRVYAEAMAKVAKDAFPIAWEAFEDYDLYAQKFSRLDIDVLASLLSSKGVSIDVRALDALAKSRGVDNKREREEMVDKMRLLGIISD